MPNWTYNTITVAEGDCDLRQFLSENEGKKYFDFNLIIPEPKTKEECIEKYGEQYIDNENSHLMHNESDEWFNWYDWHCDFWGTKWNACNSYVEDNDDGKSANFDTAWDAPKPIFQKLSEMFPDCLFETCSEYEDPSVGILECKWEAGDLISQEIRYPEYEEEEEEED